MLYFDRLDLGVMVEDELGMCWTLFILDPKVFWRELGVAPAPPPMSIILFARGTLDYVLTDLIMFLL